MIIDRLRKVLCTPLLAKRVSHTVDGGTDANEEPHPEHGAVRARDQGPNHQRNAVGKDKLNLSWGRVR